MDSSYSLSKVSTKYDISSDISDIDLSDFKYVFYWNASSDPLDPGLEKKWKLYNRTEQNKLNQDYEKFLKNNTNNICNIGDYNMNFDKFIQIHKKDESKIRPVKMISSDIDKEISNYVI